MTKPTRAVIVRFLLPTMTDQITTKPVASQARLPYTVRKKALEALEVAALKDHDPDRAAAIAATIPRLKGTPLAPGVTRLHGDLCNVHGRYGSCRAAGFGDGPKRVAPKALPKAPKPKAGGKKAGGGKKAAAKRKPIKTEEQKRTEQAQKRTERQQAKQTEQEQNRKKVLEGLGIDSAGQAALSALREGQQPDVDAVKRAGLVEAGLAEQAADGSYRLTASGRATLGAADQGDQGRAGDTISGARDRLGARQTRQAAAAERTRQADVRRAAATAKRGASHDKKPTEPKPPTKRRIPFGSSGRRASAGASGGGGGGKGAAPPPPKAQLDPALRDAAEQLSAGGEIDSATEALLIRNGLAKRSKDGVLVLTGAGLAATKKDFTPTHTTDDGHTGVMVALYPDPAAAKALVALDGVTEPVERLHLTLCFLGDSTETPLKTNKEKVIEAVAQWATEHGQPLKGTINGLGRFFHAEDDQTNAVYVSPDVAGLPELRQSLADWIEQSGFDYSHDHGFTPHITVAYVPLDAPTPPIRIETSVTFDHVTLAWGDEQYTFPLGVSQKSFTVFKDASGAQRWIARTTTAFEDRDGEVISTKALEASAASDAARGPLRWWHSGRPDPLNPDAPWGAGVDLGWCDFAALHGRTLIESGTFKSAAIARAVAAHADKLELSPGFFHAAAEPDAAGVFHHIRIFERSLVPTWAGRASNYYTGLKVQGGTMDQKKIEALQTLGLPEATIKELLGDAQQAEKSADADNVRYKESRPVVDFFRQLIRGEQTATKDAAPTTTTTKEPDQAPDPFVALKAQLDAVQAELAALKDAPAAVGADAPAAEVVVAEDAAPDAEDLTEAPEEDDGGLTLSPEDLAAIGQAVGAALEPLIGAMGITQKLDGHMGELKSMLGGFVKQKDDGEAEKAVQIAALKAAIDQQQAALAELLGDAPRGTSYRPTQASDNTLGQLHAATKDQTPDSNDWSDMAAKFFPGMLPG
jgi:2'-5' RNA ligase